MIQPLFIFSDWTIFLLRLTAGLIIFAHGIPKLTRTQAFKTFFNEIRFKPATMWAVLAGGIESLGGLFLIFGFLTQPTALVLAIEFALILLVVKIFGKRKGFEFELLFFVALLLLATLGGGAWSADEFLKMILI